MCNDLTSVTIPEGVTSIGAHAFSLCGSLTSITIPSSVSSIGYESFPGCSSLASVVVDTNNPIYDSRNNCNAIIETATNTLVMGCSNTVIPDGITSIGATAFEGCSLTSLTIPNSVTSIGEAAFVACSIKKIRLPSKLEIIGSHAFYGAAQLEEITIPANVTEIGDGAFAYCTGLKSIISLMETPFDLSEEPSSESGMTIFDKCDLSNITLYVPYGTKEKYKKCDGWKHFSNIIEMAPDEQETSFTTKTVEGVDMIFKVISEEAKTCQVGFGLEYASFGADDSNAIDRSVSGKITIPSVVNGYTVTGIGAEAFSVCYNLTEVVIPENVKYLGSDAFSICNIKKIQLPSTLEIIGSHAFHGADDLEEITIPANVTEIGDGAFSLCSGLKSIISLIETPFDLPEEPSSESGMTIFDECDLSNITLYVPYGSKEKYQQAKVWRDFPNIVEMNNLNPHVQGDVNGDNNVNGTDIVALVNIILGKQAETDAADVNGDGNVNGTDIVALCNIILGRASAPKRVTKKAEVEGQAHLSISENFDIKAGETKDMVIDLTNPNDELTLVQFDLSLPEGLSIKKTSGELAIDMCDRTTWRKHSLEANEVDGAYRFLLYSGSNTLIDGTSGGIITVTLTADDTFEGGTIVLNNSLLVTPAQKEIKPVKYEYSIGEVIPPTSETASLSIESFSIQAGETKDMVIDLTNPDDELTLVQFDLSLPDGVSIKKTGGELAIDMCDRTTWRKHSLEANEVDGAYRFLLYSGSNTLIDGTSGGIITVTLTADDTFEGGTIVLNNSLLVTPAQKEIKPVKYEYSIGEVIPPTSETASLSIESFSIKVGETKDMVIDLTNPNDELTLVQFDLSLPDGLSIKKTGGELAIDMCDRTTWRKHSLEANEVEGAYRFLLYSGSNTLIDGTSGGIITVTLTADDTFEGGTIIIDNTLLVTPAQKEIKPVKYEYQIGSTTGIGVILDKQKPLQIYNLNGQWLKQPQKGINVINGKKVMVK